jgi:hypothetical protein
MGAVHTSFCAASERGQMLATRPIFLVSRKAFALLPGCCLSYDIGCSYLSGTPSAFAFNYGVGVQKFRPILAARSDFLSQYHTR